MRCNICNAILTDKEIKNHPVTGKLEPCTVCIDASTIKTELEQEDGFLISLSEEDLEILTQNLNYQV